MWDPELAELERRKELAERMGGADSVARQHASGRLTVRERLAALTDGWQEVGALAGHDTEDGFTPSNVIIGRARIGGRRVVVCGDDFTVRGGAADAAIHEKQILAERMAGEMRVPLIRLIDGTGGGGSVKQLEEYGRTYVPYNPGWDQVVANLGRVPVIALALGPVAGLGAARLVTSHVSIMVKELSQVFIAGPAVVEAGMGERVGKEELGGWRTVAAAGTVDLVAASEQEAFDLTGQVLGYLPQNAWHPPPIIGASSSSCSADSSSSSWSSSSSGSSDFADAPDRTAPELRDLVPRDRRRPYDMRRILELVFDTGSVLELGRRFAPSLITALARLDGHPVAVLASDPRVYGGGMTAQGADKMARFVDLAETFHLPVVHLVDQPGFVIGTAAEKAGTIRRGARALAAVYQSTVPWASVLVRRVFGVAGAAHRPHDRYTLRVAWPSGDWGSLPIEGGLEVAFKRLLAEAGPDAAALKAEIAERLEAVRSPFRTAEAFLVEDIIDPAETRPVLTDWIRDAYAVLDPGPRDTTRP